MILEPIHVESRRLNSKLFQIRQINLFKLQTDEKFKKIDSFVGSYHMLYDF